MSRDVKRWLLLSAFVLLPIVVFFCRGHSRSQQLAHFKTIRPGMHESEVADLLGSPDANWRGAILSDGRPGHLLVWQERGAHLPWQKLRPDFQVYVFDDDSIVDSACHLILDRPDHFERYY